MWCKFFSKPESERDIIGEMLSSGTRIADLDSELLLELCRSQNVNTFLFNLLHDEVVARLRNGHV